MKYTPNFYSWKSILLVVVLIMLNNGLMAQVDTTAAPPIADTSKPAPVDTTAVMADTTAAVMADTTSPAPTDSTATSSKKKRNSQLIIYGGGNSNQMGSSRDLSYDVNSGVGYHFGLAWKKGGFIYGQFGVRYNNAVYGINSKVTSKDTGDLRVQAIDIPLTAGINFLSFARIVALRAYVSAMPSFIIDVNDNKVYKKEDINSFIFYGQVGLGADIAFAMLDIGYNYGFQGLLEESSKTNPGQFYISLGVKF